MTSNVAMVAVPEAGAWMGAFSLLLEEELGSLPDAWSDFVAKPFDAAGKGPLFDVLKRDGRGLNGLLYALVQSASRFGASPPSTEKPPPGFEGEIVERFSLREERPLGKGGLGTVYAATDKHSGKPVAVKIIHPHLDGNVVQFVVKNYRVVEDLSRREDYPSSLCRVEEVLELSRRIFILMELFDGRNLSSGSGKAPDLFDLFYQVYSKGPGTIARVVRQVTAGALYLFDQGWLHNDIRMENVFFRSDGSAALGDFDLLTRRGKGDLLTEGNILYWSPEQWRQEGTCESMIVWSIGFLLYELISGYRNRTKLFEITAEPQDGANWCIEVWRRMSRGDVSSLFRNWIPRNASPILLAVAAEATTFDPEERLSLAALLQRLQDVEESEGVKTLG